MAVCVCVCPSSSPSVVPGSKVGGSAVTLASVTGSALSDNNGCEIQAPLATPGPPSRRSDRVAAEEWQPTRPVGGGEGAGSSRGGGSRSQRAMKGVAGAEEKHEDEVTEDNRRRGTTSGGGGGGEIHLPHPDPTRPDPGRPALFLCSHTSSSSAFVSALLTLLLRLLWTTLSVPLLSPRDGGTAVRKRRREKEEEEEEEALEQSKAFGTQEVSFLGCDSLENLRSATPCVTTSVTRGSSSSLKTEPEGPHPRRGKFARCKI